MTSENNGVLATMPVAPAYGGYGMGGGFGGWGSDIWLIIIILFAFGGFGSMGGFGGFGGGLGYDFPWLLNGQQGINANTNAGFQSAATQSAISGLQNSVTSGFGDVQTSLCSGFAGVNATVNNAQNAISQQLFANQIADLNRSFDAQTANTQGLTNLSNQFANCCCEQRLSTANLTADLAREACADRQAVSDGVQRILDQMNNDKIDAKNERIADLERQLSMASLAASQVSQTAQLMTDNNLQTQYIVNRVTPYPIPAYIVPNPVTPSV